MSELFRGWHDVLKFLFEPLFTIGDTPISLVRLCATGLVMWLVWWASGVAERSLRGLGAHRGAQFSAGSAYAVGRVTRYLLLTVGLLFALSVAESTLPA